MSAKAMTRQESAVSDRRAVASWLWDPDRRRIIWADRAGLAFWREASTAEIAERVFSPRSGAAVAFARLLEAARGAADGIAERRILLSPAERHLRADCRGSLATLPDGRQGLRIVARPAPAGAGAEADRLREILDELPYAASLFAENGALLFQNTAAETSFAGPQMAALVRRFNGRDAARAAIRATLVNGTHDTVIPVRTVHGVRRNRVMLRRMHDPVSGDLSVLIMFQDMGDGDSVPAVTAADVRLIDLAPGGIASFAVDGRASFLNAEARRLLGLGASERPRLRDLVPGQRRRIEAAMDKPRASLDVVATGGRALSLSLRRLETGGWAAALSEMDARRLTANRDMADTKSRLKALAMVRAGSVVVDKAGRIEQIDDAGVSLLAIRVGDAFSKAFTTDSGMRLSSLLSGQTPAVETLRGRGGRTLRVAAVPHGDGRCVLAIAEQGAARRGTLDRSETVARVSHELRTPMNAVLGFTEIMLAEPGKIGDPRFREYLADIHSAGRRVVALADDLLDFRRLEAGAMALQRAPVDLGNLIRGLAKELSVRAERGGVAITLAIDPALPRIMGDAHSLRQAFSSLLTNAVKYAGSGRSVRVAGARLPDGSARVDIIDTGPGMSADELERAMEPFGRVAGGEGAGLGLPLAKGLIEANGGRFGVETEKGVGLVASATFGPDEVVQ